MAGYYTQRRKSVSLDLGSVTTFTSGPPSESKEVVSYVQETVSFRNSPGEGATQTYNDLLATNKFGSQSVMDNGHEFSTRNVRVVGVKPERRELVHSNGIRISAPVVLWDLQDDFRSATTRLPIPDWDVTTRNAQGNKAIKNTVPTSPVFSFANFLGEFARDGLPSIAFASFVPALKGKSDFFKRAGSEYLNAQFGWVPFIKDLEKMLRVVSNSYKMLEQYKRDSGRVVRRSFSFPLVQEERLIRDSVQTSNPYYPGWTTGSGGFTAFTTTSQRNIDKIYFRGAYSYFIPTNSDFIGKAEYYASLADYLLGIKITPEVLWNLAPWSWLVDWFVNVGDNLSVASAFEKDNLVLRYGYLMREYSVVRKYSSTPGIGNGSLRGNTIPAQYQYVRHTSKRRVRAEPYGFGFNTEALSQTQWAILAALGLSGQGEPEWGKSRKR